LFTSLALDASGKPCVSYFDERSHMVKYAAWDGSKWGVQEVAQVAGLGIQVSLAVDSSGRPHIGYQDHMSREIKYATRTGSAWDIQTVADYAEGGSLGSVALDGNGRPHISYCADGVLKHAFGGS
jgi:hypothetical protein